MHNTLELAQIIIGCLVLTFIIIGYILSKYDEKHAFKISKFVFAIYYIALAFAIILLIFSFIRFGLGI